MAETTTNYGLTKPLPEEFYDINVHNENMNIIDRQMKALNDALSGAGNVFLAEYGVTKSAEITAALNAEKAVFCVYTEKNLIAPLISVSTVEAVIHAFTVCTKTGITTITCVSDVWNAEETLYPSSGDYTYGTSDLTEGVSELETGKLHFVYE